MAVGNCTFAHERQIKSLVSHSDMPETTRISGGCPTLFYILPGDSLKKYSKPVCHHIHTLFLVDKGGDDSCGLKDDSYCIEDSCWHHIFAKIAIGLL